MEVRGRLGESLSGGWPCIHIVIELGLGRLCDVPFTPIGTYKAPRSVIKEYAKV